LKGKSGNDNKPAKKESMKSLFAISLSAAALCAASVYADSALVAPHWKDADQRIPMTKSWDRATAKSGCVLGSPHCKNAAGVLPCKQIGKASCSDAAMPSGCCVKAPAACCK
jgi:hypothetical protein